MCGTSYYLDEEHNPIRIESWNGNIKTVSCETRMPGEYVLLGDAEHAAEYTLHEIAHRMAERLVPFIEYEQTYDPRCMEYITRARLRVADPYSLHRTTSFYRGR
jgi:hypothetical protein